MSWCSIVGCISWGWGWLVSSTLLYPSLLEWWSGQRANDRYKDRLHIFKLVGWYPTSSWPSWQRKDLWPSWGLSFKPVMRDGKYQETNREICWLKMVLYTKVNDPIPQVSPHVYWSYLLTFPLMIVNGKPFLIWRWKPQIEGLNLTMMMNYEWLWSLGFQEQVMKVFCSKIRGDLNIMMEERGISSN